MDIFSSPLLHPKDGLLKIASHIDLEPQRFIIQLKNLMVELKNFPAI